MLTPAQKKALRSASRAPIQNYFETLPVSIKGAAWLQAGNRYRVSCIDRYKRDLGKPPAFVRHRSMVSYVSASAPVHTIDGWSFLGRAIDAALRGDTYSAVHFGYYAELRAAMALLASEGLGIMGADHPVIEKSDRTNRFPPDRKNRFLRTHRVTWAILRYWATLARARELLNKLVKPYAPIETWFDWFGVASNVQAVAYSWLSNWGMDLRVAGEDQELRNLASYRPSEFRLPEQLSCAEVTGFIEELWSLFEPGSAGSRFPLLEKHLLRVGLRKSGAKVGNSRAILSTKGLSVSEADAWAAFIEEDQDHSLFLAAVRQSEIDDPRCHLEVIARATLLLYFSSSAVRQCLKLSGLSSSDLQFWWAKHGKNRGIWETLPASIDDIWADVESVVSSSRNWRHSNSATSQNLTRWRRDNPESVNLLGNTELICFWSLLP